MNDPPEFVRARNPQQKEERRAVLLQTAASLLGERGSVHAFSLNELAREAGMAKSNVYRYFESREALLLELLELEWIQWFEAFVGKGAKRRLGLAKLLDQMTRGIAARPLLCSLMAVLPSVLEHNTSAEKVRDFKLATLGFVQAVGQQCHLRCPELSIEEYCQLVHLVFLVQTSLWAYASPSAALEEALRDPRLASFRHDFETDFSRTVLLLARGLIACR